LLVIHGEFGCNGQYYNDTISRHGKTSSVIHGDNLFIYGVTRTTTATTTITIIIIIGTVLYYYNNDCCSRATVLSCLGQGNGKWKSTEIS